MNNEVDIIEITLGLSVDGFIGNIKEHLKSNEAKIWITLRNCNIYNRIYKKSLLKPSIMGLDRHDNIRKRIFCYKKDKKKAFKILKEAIFSEFYKREKHYYSMKTALINSDSYEEFVDWFTKEQNNGKN